MENIVKCVNCGKEVSDKKYVYHELKEADMSWYHCYECEEYLSTHGDKPFVAPKEKEEEEIIECDYCGIALPKNKAILYEWDEENLAWYYCKVCSDMFQGHIRITEKDIEKKKRSKEKEKRSDEFYAVIGYFNSLIDSHNSRIRIITDERDHKHFMDELNYYADDEENYCTNIIPCRLWFGFSGEELLQTIFIDDRTTMDDIDFKTIILMIKYMQTREKIEMEIRHKIELEDLKEQEEFFKEQENISPGPTTIPDIQKTNSSRSKRK